MKLYVVSGEPPGGWADLMMLRAKVMRLEVELEDANARAHRWQLEAMAARRQRDAVLSNLEHLASTEPAHLRLVEVECDDGN